MSNLKKSVSIALGATFAAGLAATPFANAAENPFGLKSLESGYQQLAANDKDSKNKEGKCGEGKCGDSKEMKKEMTKSKEKSKEMNTEQKMEQEQEQEMEQSQ